MDTNSTAPKDSAKSLIVLMLVLELLALIPWAVFSALSFMGFDSGFHIQVVLMMAPFWIYPVLILVCAFLAFSFNRKGRLGAATAAIFAPLSSWAWLFGLMVTA